MRIVRAAAVFAFLRAVAVSSVVFGLFGAILSTSIQDFTQMMSAKEQWHPSEDRPVHCSRRVTPRLSQSLFHPNLDDVGGVERPKHAVSASAIDLRAAQVLLDDAPAPQ